jgi:arabinofuranosyltransferase
VLGLAVASLIGLAERYSELFHRSAVDDALISMQYARNWVLGKGLVFNAGERVEGYTNFLWVVVLAPLYALSSSVALDFGLLVARVNIAIAALTLLFVYAIGKQIWGSSVLPTLVALGLCVVDNSFVVWATLGLESHLLALCMLIAVWFAGTSMKTRGIGIGLALTAAQMTRPDAGLFNVVFISGLGAEWFAAQKRGDAAQEERLKALLAAILTWVGVYGVYFLWRYQYYGWLLPNTYYVKVGAGDFDGWDRGLSYVRSFLSERAWLPALALASAAFVVKGTALRSVTIYLAVHTLYVMSVGGDYFTGHRFFVAQIPLFALVLAAALHELIGRSARKLGATVEKHRELGRMAPWIAACALSALLWLLFENGKQNGPLRTEILEQGGLVRINRNFMGWLSQHKPPHASFATCAIGSAGFDGNFERVVDTCGVIDPVIAHRPAKNFGKGIPGHEKNATLEEVLAKKPTYIDPMGSLLMNYWSHGYYFDASMRLDLAKTVEGVWRRDELLDRGTYLREHAWHFDPGQTGGWSAEGGAFANFPTLARSPKQFAGIGEHGPHANSFSDWLGDLPTGRLMSPLFPLVGDLMVLRVGGGHDPDRLRVALWVDGRPVLSTTGLDSEHLSRREWDIRPYRGKLARLEILDASDGPRGHIMVDEVLQWRSG